MLLELNLNENGYLLANAEKILSLDAFIWPTAKLLLIPNFYAGFGSLI